MLIICGAILISAQWLKRKDGDGPTEIVAEAAS
jgi:hypothetical protein